MNRSVKTAGIAVLAVAAVSTVAALVVRDQVHRHQRDLFNPKPIRRLACLGHMARAEATVDNITLLRDFVTWEPRRLLRNRARSILRRMEGEAQEAAESV